MVMVKDSVKTSSLLSETETIPLLLERCAQENPSGVFARSDEWEVNYKELNSRVNRLANGLIERGVKPGDRVIVMLNHHLEHALTFYAIAKAGAVQVPVNVALKGPSLSHLVSDSSPQFLIAEQEYADVLQPIIDEVSTDLACIWRQSSSIDVKDDSFAAVASNPNDTNPDITTHDRDLRVILYTSGTTGAAKGVLMTDRMFRAAALGSSWVGDIQPGSVMHFWDPMYHVFGSEVLVLALMVPITLAFVPRFSASRFWDETRRFGATHIHFVGGVLQLLLKQPESAMDKQHPVRIAWGGGAPLDVWQEFQERFGVEVREGYGMTETSSFSVINTTGKIGSIGKAIDFFKVEIVDENGVALAPGEIGEIRVAEIEPGTITTGYFRNPEKTAEAIRNGWLYTGDLGRQDEEGYIYFLGRKKDSLRRRGENISAWEVEQVVNAHPKVEESALIGVVNELQDEDLKLFIKLKPEVEDFDCSAFVEWCKQRMAAFQVPRFIEVVEKFSLTPTHRIQKQTLSQSVEGCWDSEAGRR